MFVPMGLFRPEPKLKTGNAKKDIKCGGFCVAHKRRP
jgi:hypothetical protein